MGLFVSYLESVTGKKWIQDAIENKGSLREELGKKKGDKITKADLNKEEKKIDADGKVTKAEAHEKKQIVLAKTLAKVRK